MEKQIKEQDNQKMGVLGFPIHNTTCLKRNDHVLIIIIIKKKNDHVRT